MPGNVWSTLTCAPGVTPSANRRPARAWACVWTSTTTPCAPSSSEASDRTRLELDAKRMEDIVQPCSGQDRDRRDDADNRETGFHTTPAHQHQKVHHARDEQR